MLEPLGPGLAMAEVGPTELRGPGDITVTDKLTVGEARAKDGFCT